YPRIGKDIPCARITPSRFARPRRTMSRSRSRKTSSRRTSRAIACSARTDPMAELRTETMTVNMGPQHPSTHGVLRLVLELDGETIKSCMPTIGYLHTGIEKTAEQKK